MVQDLQEQNILLTFAQCNTLKTIATTASTKALNAQHMKILWTIIFLSLPLLTQAQNVWEVPKSNSETADTQQQAKQEAEAAKRAQTEKYLAGAVPQEKGKVVFTLDRDVPGLTAEEIYQRVYKVMETLTKEENQFDLSRVVAVNKQEHTLVARLKEWLVFQSSFISLDRTVMQYTLIAKCSPEHLHLTMERIGYQYEMERGHNAGLSVSADEWITDDKALKKNGTKLKKYNAKFRTKTIDRKDNIFQRVCAALGINYNSTQNAATH